jgi:YfiR/HmsC-like
MDLLSRRAFAIGLALCGFPLRGAAQAAATEDLLEYEVKAAFVFQFGEFVDWPEHALGAPGTPFTIAVLGADPVAEVLEQLGRQRHINGRPVVVRRLQRADAIPPAHILFVGAADSDRLRAAAEPLKAASTLTVSETTRPSQPSGVINFVIRDNRVRFEIDAEAAEQSKLKISSKVLSLAVLVKGSRQK